MTANESDGCGMRVPLVAAGCLGLGAGLAAGLRVADAIAGRTVYSLLAFVAAAALGFAAGGLSGRVAGGRKIPSAVLLAAAFGAVAAWSVFVWATAEEATVSAWQPFLTGASRSFGAYAARLAALAGRLFVVPAAAVGWVAAVSCRRPGGPDAPRAAVAGCVALVAGFTFGDWAAAAAGAERFERLSVLWFGAVAAVSVLAGGARNWRRAAYAAGLFAAVAAALVLFPFPKTSVLCEGVFGRVVYRDSGFAWGKPFFEHHTARHTVAVYKDPDYRFVFALDGRSLLFGNRFHTARTLTGYVPLLVRPTCKRAAVMGAEAGLYLPFFARAGVSDLHYGAADADVVRLAIAADAYLSGDDTCERLAPQRDAALSPQGGYDVVFLTGEPVWMRGTRGAYSRAWFARCKKALSADGIVALHLDARALSLERFASVSASFAAVFPGVQLWCTGANDWVLVGGKAELKAPVDRLLVLFEKKPVFRDFVRAGGLGLPEALACMVCDGRGLAPWLAKTGRESAWHALWSAPRNVFSAYRLVLRPATMEACRQRKSQWILPGELDVDVYLGFLDKVGRVIGGRAVAAKALERLDTDPQEVSIGAVREAAQLDVRDALLIPVGESMELEGRRRIKIGDLKGALKCFENLLSISSDSAFAHYEMGYCLRGSGDNEGAYLHFSRAVASAPEQTDYRLEMASAALAVGEFSEADRQYREVLKREPDNPAALFLAAKALAARERPQKDFDHALKLAERACALTQWKNREYAYGLADLYMDAGKVLEGMGLKRRLKENFSSASKSSDTP